MYDLGGTHLRCAIATTDGALEGVRKHVIRLESGTTASEGWRKIVALIARFEIDNRDRLDARAPGVIAFPGPIEGQRRVVVAPTLFGEVDALPPLIETLEATTARRFRVLNDVSAAAWHLSGVVEAKRFLVVTVSSGIGSKIFDREHPRGVIDDPPYAGEIGHFVCDWSKDAPICECGGRGHLGAIASGRGIELLARRRALEHPASFEGSMCQVLGATPTSLSNEAHLVPAVLAGDPWAVETVIAGTRPLAQAIQTVFLAMGVDRVVIIGGFATALGDTYLRLIRGLVEECSRFAMVANELEELITIAEVGSETCLAGAAAFSLRAFPQGES